jgi:hypothetical protein
MMNSEKKGTGWKQSLVREMIEYSINFSYLAVFFGVFAWYRRLVLTEYHISYLDYGAALFEALVLAKVIMLGDILHLGMKLEDKPLIMPALYKAVVFTVWVGFFDLFEHTIEGLLRGKGLAGGFDELMTTGWHELLARCLVIFFAFIPFFAFKELGRILGENSIRELYFRRRATRFPRH